MKQPLLTIQIPYTPDRYKEYVAISSEIGRQIIKGGFQEVIEIQSDGTGKELSIGEKRDLLYKQANGNYVFQFDSDDWIAENGIELIMAAIKKDADCITFQEYVNLDGREFKSNHSLKYQDWDGDGKRLLYDGFHFHRLPFFKSVIKTDIAKRVPVPHIRFGEDHLFSKALRPHLKTEVHIDSEIYRYMHIATDHHERYGIEKPKHKPIQMPSVTKKFGQYGDITNAMIKNGELIIKDGAGITSCLSIRLDNAIAYKKIYGVYPREIDSSSQFLKYADFNGQNVSELILKGYSPINNLPFVDYIGDWQFHWYDEIKVQRLKDIANFVCPLSDKIIQKAFVMCKKMEDRTVCLYRGNDKGLEIPRTPYEAMEQLAIESGSDKFLVQTDEEDFYQWFKERFPDTICFDEIPRINKNPDSYVMPPLGERVEFAMNFLAALKAISTAPKLITTTGNTAIWAILFRGKTEGVYQWNGNYNQGRKF